MEYTDEQIAEVVKAYADLVEAKNLLEGMRGNRIPRSPYNQLKAKQVKSELIPNYLKIVPQGIRDMLPIKTSDLEKIIGNLIA